MSEGLVSEADTALLRAALMKALERARADVRAEQASSGGLDQFQSESGSDRHNDKRESQK